MLVSFLSSNILLCIEKNPWENYVKFRKWNLKRTPHSAQNSFFRKSKVFHYIQHDFIRQRPGLSKDQTSMFKSLAVNYVNCVIIFITLIADIRKGILIKDDKYFFF